MRILLLTQTAPWPVGQGGNAQRTGLIREALRCVGQVDVCFVKRADRADDPGVRDFIEQEGSGFAGVLAIPHSRTPVWSDLEQRGPRTSRALAREMAGLSGPFREGRRQLGELSRLVERGYDLIVARYLKTAVRSGLSFMASGPRTILDVDDVDWLKTRRRFDSGEVSGRLRLLRRLLIPWLSERRYRPVLCSFDHVWAVTENDRRHLGLERSSVLPNVPVAEPIGRFLERSTGPPRVLFVGNLGYAPNRQGVERFIVSVWPAVRREVPTSVLRLVGRALCERDRERWSEVPGVEVVGYADDLEPHYAASMVVVAPVYWGGGTPIKVLEALAYARPVVAAPHACDAFEGTLHDGVEVWRAETDRDFARGVVSLLTSEELRARMASAGLYAISRHFSRDSFSNRVVETLRNVTESG